MQLWVSMIVRDEEGCLTGCLESVKDADGIVVVDTGSLDKTPEIALQYTSNVSVGEYRWNDDFAEARNFALDKIPCQEKDYWVLSIDADEILEEGGISKIKNVISNSKSYNTVSVRMLSSTGSSEHWYPRIFKKGIRWVGIAHEALSVVEQNKQDIVIRYGSSAAHQNDPQRMFRILRKAVVQERNARNLYYLAREYWYLKEYKTAISLWKEALLKSSWKPERADTYLMIARCYWALNRGDEAREACANAILINAHFKEACLFMATLSWPKNASQWRVMSDSADNSNVLFVRPK